MRPGPDIGMTVGYMYQTEWDLRRLVAMTQNNAEIYGALGLSSAPTSANTFFYGHSLGAMLGANLISGTPIMSSGPPIGGYVLAAPGGDATDIILNGAFGPTIIAGVVAGDPIRYDNSTVVGAANLNSTISALEMITTHGLFKGFVDPMNRAIDTSSTPVLIQQMEGDLTISNSNTILLKYGMLTSRYADGDGSQAGNRVSWDYEACKYDLSVTNNADVLHGFALDWTNTSTAASQSQTQAATFFASGGTTVVDPSAGLTGICN
jgi:pimeloyl-ACP methyl ester carboxylesterase